MAKKDLFCGCLLAAALCLTGSSVQAASEAGAVMSETAGYKSVEVKNTDSVVPMPESYVENADVFTVAGLKTGQLTGDYRLAKYDVIVLSVLGFPNGLGYTTGSSANEKGEADSVQIGPDGKASLPYVGSVKLAGLTLDEATELIRSKLSRYVKIPEMYLSVKSYGPRKVYVMGEVKSPGIQNMNIDNLNAYAALASAGGITKYGRSTRVQVIRVVDGTMYYRQLNIKNFIRRHDLTQNVFVQDGDIVYVPKSNAIFWHEDILPYFQAWTYYKAITN